MKEFCRFVKTCSACPEQYDVIMGDKKIAYIRLRWGVLTCQMGNSTIYEYYFNDNMKGCFDSDDEREIFFGIILKVIMKYIWIHMEL